jgi:predicted Kef-type K+ transport protein
VAGNILVAWVMTVPSAGLVGAAMESITRLPGGAAIVFVLAIMIAATAFLARSWQTRRASAAAAVPAAPPT